MYKIVRRISENFILIFTLSVIILFVSLGASFIKEYSNNIYEQDYYIGKNSVGFNVTNFDNISYKQLLECVIEGGNYNVFNTRMIASDFSAHGIYLKEDLKVIPELIQGRFFNIEDFKKSDEKLAVIGKGLINKAVKEGENSYITFNNDKYRIIGIMGNKDKQKMFDYTMIFNLNSLEDSDDYMKISEGWYISNNDSNEDLSEVVKQINKKLLGLGQKSSLMETEANVQPNPTMTAIKNNKNMIYYFAILVSSIALNILIIVQQWIGQLEKQIGIRKAFGAKNAQIYWFVFKSYIESSAIASFIALVVQTILLRLGFFQADQEVTMFNFFVVIAFSLVFSAILLCLSIRRLNKLQPNHIMRG